MFAHTPFHPIVEDLRAHAQRLMQTPWPTRPYQKAMRVSFKPQTVLLRNNLFETAHERIAQKHHTEHLMQTGERLFKAIQTEVGEENLLDMALSVYRNGEMNVTILLWPFATQHFTLFPMHPPPDHLLKNADSLWTWTRLCKRLLQDKIKGLLIEHEIQGEEAWGQNPEDAALWKFCSLSDSLLRILSLNQTLPAWTIVHTPTQTQTPLDNTKGKVWFQQRVQDALKPDSPKI